MELNDYISKAKQDFPNGFSDYIKEHGDKTEWWFQFYKRNNLVEQVNGYTFDYSEKHGFYILILRARYNHKIQLKQ